MKKNKLRIASFTCLLLLSTCIAVTFAWFSARDDVMNRFSTAKAIDPDNPNNQDYGVKIEENWKPEDGQNIVPGVEVNKDVKVRNKATYDSFIRVKLEPIFTSCKEGVDLSSLNTSNLNLKMVNLTDESSVNDENWILGDDGYYYFLKIVKPEEDTKYLLDSVTLNKNVKKMYGNASFDINVHAESIQAANGAAKHDWQGAGSIITDKLSSIAKDARLE